MRSVEPDEMRGFVLGVVVTLVVALVAGFTVVNFGLFSPAADRKPLAARTLGSKPFACRDDRARDRRLERPAARNGR